MPELDAVITHNYRFGVAAPKWPESIVKGSAALDWGMQNRLHSIFSGPSGRTVMLAIDHGYFQGPTSGLEPR